GASAPDAAAATVVLSWQARIGATNALSDTATLQVYDTSRGVLRIRATKLRAGSSYTVTLYKGRCGWMATKLMALPSVTTTSTGALTRNLGMSVAQVKTVRSTWNAGAGVAVQLARGSSKRCGDLGALIAPGKAVRLENEQTHTVVKAEAWSGEGMWDPQEGSSYVTVYVRIKARTATHYSTLDYSLIDGRGKEWSGLVFGDREPEISYGDLSTGESVEGWVTLMGPTDQLNRLTLAYRMNGMLHGPTLYVPLGVLGTVAPAEPPIELRAAVAAGKVAVTGTGSGLQRLEITVTSRDTGTLGVAITSGTVFHPSLGATQTMVTITSKTLALAPGESKTLTLDVACAAMHLDQPGSSDQFALDPAQAGGPLVSLLGVPDFAGQTFRVKQFAIWTITDNPPRGGYVGIGSFGFGTGPSDAEIVAIRQLFVKAGLDPSAYIALV
ncbi:MAG TPA: hypothetical protein VFW02_05160, partial [Candidatus Limnocylindrales bacterium]|nr:hypothetical protein [Candidatus Limnocylindrales bacterium]